MAQQMTYLTGAVVRVDRNHGNTERVQRQPMQQECWSIF